MAKYKIIDLFAGAGGLSNGFEQTGNFEVLGAVEINPAAANTFIKNHGENENIIIKTEENVSDITCINFKEFLRQKNIEDKGDIVVIGGPPCQGFSNANRQKNYLISGNNQLVKEFVRTIVEIEPVAFLMENVKTMESHTHKFFITKSDGKKFSKYYLGSEEHRKKVMEKNNDNSKPFWNEELITLVETDDNQLSSILNNVLNNNEGIEPFLVKGYLSRLKTIVKRSDRKEKVKLKNKKETDDVSDLIYYFNMYKKSDDYKKIEQVDGAELFNDAEVILKNLVVDEVDSKELKKYLNPLITLNGFLLTLNELEEERIAFQIDDGLRFTEKGWKVQAKVKTYNIVVYLKQVFEALGYEINSDVLTASDYGVPQRRKRFMILGVKKECVKNGKVELPKSINRNYTTKDAIYDLETMPPSSDFEALEQNYDIAQYKTPLQYYFRKNNKENTIKNHVNTKSNELSIKRFEEIKKQNGKNFHSLTEELKNTYADASRARNTVYLRLNYEEPSPTVVNVRKSMWSHPKNAVAISIREAARLQSFKDNFEFLGTKDQQYQQVGNAVPPLMARAVAEQMLNILGERPINKSLQTELDESLAYFQTENIPQVKLTN